MVNRSLYIEREITKGVCMFSGGRKRDINRGSGLYLRSGHLGAIRREREREIKMLDIRYIDRERLEVRGL